MLLSRPFLDILLFEHEMDARAHTHTQQHPQPSHTPEVWLNSFLKNAIILLRRPILRESTVTLRVI